MIRRGAVLVLLTAGCNAAHPGMAAPAGSAAPVPAASAGCGASPCTLFDGARAAFTRVLEPPPAVLGIGEAHAQKGSENIEPATRRFSRELLPLLKGRASDIVIELMLPNPRCAPEAKKAQKEQKVVTEHQAATDQNDYVALGTAAQALGIRPHALEPTCDDLAHISRAGDDVVTVSLDVVTRLATETLTRLAAANAAAHDERMVVAYGGILHNDVAPRPGREQWSFGPALGARTRGRYTELDLIVPELMNDSPTWQSLPWVAGFDRDAHAGKAVLLAIAPRGWVLVFPMGSGATPPAPSGSP
jgi:hypothetical protein